MMPVDPVVFYLAAGVVGVVIVILFALLGAEQRPVITKDDDALKRAQLDVATRLGKSPSVIVPKAGNGRP